MWWRAHKPEIGLTKRLKKKRNKKKTQIESLDSVRLQQRHKRHHLVADLEGVLNRAERGEV